MKKVIALVLCLVMVGMLLCACAAEEEPAPDTTSENASDTEAVKVLVLAKKLADPYSTWLMNMTEKYLTEEYPDVEYTILDQEGDPANTESFYDQAVLDGYDVVILQKVSGSQDTDDLLQSYAEQGIRTVCINNSVDDGVSCSVYYPEFEMGYMIGQYAAEQLPENAKVCMLKSTPSLYSSEERCKGYLAALEDRPDVEILDTQNVEGWNKDIAITVMSDWCQRFDQIDGVLSVNDGMCLGAIEAAKADGRDVQSMFFSGIDGLADGCLSIEAGELKGSVLQDAAAMAEGGVEMAMKLVANPDMEAEQLELDPTLITTENIETYLEMHRENGVIQ